MRIFRTILTPLLLLLTIVGCRSERATLEAIEHAEHIVKDYPDSALRIVRGVNPDNLRGKRDKMHYRLVLSEALYHNRIDSDCDTLTRPLFDYYMYSDSHAERARAMYQHAYVMLKSGNNAHAMYALMMAEESLQHSNNPHLAGMIHRCKGDIYHDEYLFQNAINEYLAAIVYFEEIGLDYHVSYSNMDIGRTYLAQHDFDNSEIYLNKALEYATNVNVPKLTSEIVYFLAQTYSLTYQYTKLSDIYASYQDYLLIVPEWYYLYKAVIYANENDKENTVACLTKAREAGCEEGKINYYSYKVFDMLEDYESALYHYENCMDKQNENVLSALDASILNLQLEIVKQDKLLLLERSKNLRTRNTIFIATAIIILICVAVYFITKQKKNRLEREQYITTIKELQLSTRNLSSTMAQHIDELYKSRFCELNKLCDIYFDSEGSSRQESAVFSQLQAIIENIKTDNKRIIQLEKIVNDNYDNIFAKLAEQCPKLSERQRRIALYCYAGFSLRAISLFMDSNPILISKTKYKIKAIIINSEAKDVDTLIKYL